MMLWSDMRKNAIKIVTLISDGDEWSEVIREHVKLRLPSERSEDLVYITAKARSIPLPDDAAFRECKRSEWIVQRILSGNPPQRLPKRLVFSVLFYTLFAFLTGLIELEEFKEVVAALTYISDSDTIANIRHWVIHAFTFIHADNLFMGRIDRPQFLDAIRNQIDGFGFYPPSEEEVQYALKNWLPEYSEKIHLRKGSLLYAKVRAIRSGKVKIEEVSTYPFSTVAPILRVLYPSGEKSLFRYIKEMVESEVRSKGDKSILVQAGSIRSEYIKRGLVSETGIPFPIKPSFFPEAREAKKLISIDKADAATRQACKRLKHMGSRYLLGKLLDKPLTRDVEIIFLGGSAIGRSSIVVRSEHFVVVLDYGYDAFRGQSPPWIPEVETIDAVVITHSHLDHIGGLIELYKEGYDGPWYAHWRNYRLADYMLRDAMNVRYQEEGGFREGESMHILDVIRDHFVPLKYGEEFELANEVDMRLYNAAHVLGSSSVLLGALGRRIYYTGDFKLTGSVSLGTAETPDEGVDVVIMDGTYALKELPSLIESEQRLIQVLEDTNRFTLIPAYALGRTQEILAILKKHGVRQKIGVGGLAATITKTVEGEYNVDYIEPGLPEEEIVDRFDIVVSSSGTLKAGLSRKLYEYLVEKKRRFNLIFTGHLFPGTLGYAISTGKVKVPETCIVHEVRFTGHTDRAALLEFMNRIESTSRFFVHTPYPRVDIKKQYNADVPYLMERIKL